MTIEITTHRVDGVGLVELPGTGPWRVHEINRNSFDIKDAENRVCNPTVTAAAKGGRGEKRNQNVVYADKAIPNVIVAKFNLELAKAPI